MAQTGSTDFVVFCAGAVQSVIPALLETYRQESGHTIKFDVGTAGSIAKRIAEGASGDVVIAAASDLAALAQAGKVDGASIRDLGSMGVGVAVRAGALLPDIHDVASFRRSLLAARSIMCGNPAKGGQSEIHIAKVLAGLGLDRQLGAKIAIARQRAGRICGSRQWRH